MGKSFYTKRRFLWLLVLVIGVAISCSAGGGGNDDDDGNTPDDDQPWLNDDGDDDTGDDATDDDAADDDAADDDDNGDDNDECENNTPPEIDFVYINVDTNGDGWFSQLDDPPFNWECNDTIYQVNFSYEDVDCNLPGGEACSMLKIDNQIVVDWDCWGPLPDYLECSTEETGIWLGLEFEQQIGNHELSVYWVDVCGAESNQVDVFWTITDPDDDTGDDDTTPDDDSTMDDDTTPFDDDKDVDSHNWVPCISERRLRSAAATAAA